MEIISVDKNNIDDVIDFLKEVSLVSDINEDVLLNGEVVFDGQIIGLLSFEEFCSVGLIRYFIFRKSVTNDLIKKLFNKIVSKAKNKNIDLLITLVVKKEARLIFKSIGFNEISNDDVYIDEININETKFKDAIVLKYDII